MFKAYVAKFPAREQSGYIGLLYGQSVLPKLTDKASKQQALSETNYLHFYRAVKYVSDLLGRSYSSFLEG